MTVEPRIYVACLASYNAGVLHGEWIDVAGMDADDIGEQVDKMLERSPTPDSEEWAIHDYQGFGPNRISEWESFERIATLAKLYDDHGEAGMAFGFMVEDLDLKPDGFHDHYRGTWSSFTEYAEQLFDDIYGEVREFVDNSSCIFVDYEMFAREISSEYTTFTVSDGLAIFEDYV